MGVNGRPFGHSIYAAELYTSSPTFLQQTGVAWNFGPKTTQSRERMAAQKFTPEIISAAIDGFEAQKTRIDARIAELRAMLPGAPPQSVDKGTTEAAPQRKRRKFSAGAIRRMKEAQQRRWAKVRGESAPTAPVVKPEPAKPARRLSKAGRANIVAALKKRWAAKKAAAAKTVVKKAAVKAPTAKAAKKTAPAKKATAKKAAAKKAPAATQAAAQTAAD